MAIKICTSVFRVPFLVLGMMLASVQAQVASELQITGASTTPAVIRAYESFTVDVTFDRDICVNELAMIAGARVTADRLTISLANLDAQGGNCATRKKFVWPGLPQGAYSVEVGIGKRMSFPTANGSSTMVLSTSATAPLQVSASGGTTISIYLNNRSFGGPGYSWRLLRQTTNFATVGDGPPININETAGGPMAAFEAWAPSSTAAATTELYELFYVLPNSQERFFYTTRPDERDALVRAGFTYAGTQFKVIAVINGACATGLRPIYRLFNPTLIAHKFVGVDTHALLAGSGWISEQISFCAAPDVDRATRWQPN